MALNQLKTDSNPNTKAEFVRPGTREIKAPRRKGCKLSDDTTDCAKLMWFGAPGSGKTHLIGQFVSKLEKRVGLISTDLGGSGHLTIKAQLKQAGRLDLLDNVYLLPLEGWDEVNTFLNNPYTYDPGLWEHNPDILAWDGFSTFQQIDVSEHVGDMAPGARSDGSGRDRGDYREEGVVLEQVDWGAIKNITIRSLKKFLALHRPDGTPVHKILTCAEAIAYKPVDSSKKTGPQVATESFKPMLQGAGGQMLLGGFDLIVRCKATVKREDDKAQRVYTLVTQGSQNLVAKNRGFDLEPEIPADAAFLWQKILEGIGAGVLTKAE